MKTTAGLLLAALAAAGMVAMRDDGRGDGGIAAPAAAGGFVPLYVIATQGGGECTVERLPSGPGDRHAGLRPAADCAGVDPDLARVRYWREDADGTVAFLSETGSELLKFGPDDGPGYLSFAPASAQLTLAELSR